MLFLHLIQNLNMLCLSHTFSRPVRRLKRLGNPPPPPLSIGPAFALPALRQCRRSTSKIKKAPLPLLAASSAQRLLPNLRERATPPISCPRSGANLLLRTAKMTYTSLSLPFRLLQTSFVKTRFSIIHYLCASTATEPRFTPFPSKPLSLCGLALVPLDPHSVCACGVSWGFLLSVHAIVNAPK